MATRSAAVTRIYLPPVIFNFHGYPWLTHRPAYRRSNHANLQVRGIDPPEIRDWCWPH